MNASKPVMIASDVHLGATHPDQERAFWEWTEHAADTASALILNGDLFDFWFEYRAGIPRGYDGAVARLKEIVAGGLPITLMGGNHDWWGGTYLVDEVGLEFLRAPTVRDLAGHRTLLAHGDGLGRGDAAYRLLLRPALRNPLTRLVFGLLPIDLGDRIAGHVSNTEKRWDQWGERQKQRSTALEAWATDTLRARTELDLVLLGHTHLPQAREVAPGRWYVNSGDWVFHTSYVTLEAGRPPLLSSWRDR